MLATLTEEFRDDPRVVLMKGRSTDVLSQFEDGRLDAVYIDTCHVYAETVVELELSWRKVASGGVIMGHDYHLPGVTPAVDEFCRKHKVAIEWLAQDVGPSFGIIRP